MNWQSDAGEALLVLPPAAASLDEAHAAIELWEHYSGKTLDPAQRLAVQVMMAETADGKWAAATTGREMPRQNGKGDEIEVVELWGLVQRAEAILHTVHDAVLLASQAQQRMLSVLEGHADLRRLVKRKWQGTGQQMIEMRNGGVIWYRTRTNGGGRGVDDIDRLVIDEAQHAAEEHLAAVAPTLLANPNPQLNAMGTAGLAGKSDWWWSVRKRALGPDPGAFGYVGHTAERVYLDDTGQVVQEPVNVEDRDLWRRSNPAMAAGRGQGLAFLEEQLRRLGPVSFAREHLGVWDPPPGEGGSDIDLKLWASLEHVEDRRPNPVALAVTVNQDHSWATIGLAGRRGDGLAHVQVVQSGKGTGWVIERLVELVASHKPSGVALNPSSPAGALIHPLMEAGIEPVMITGREWAQACGRMWDAIENRKVRHQNQPVLNVAVRAAGRQPRGDAWVWRSSMADTDVEPLEAVTLALHALGKPAKQRSGKVYV